MGGLGRRIRRRAAALALAGLVAGPVAHADSSRLARVGVVTSPGGLTAWLVEDHETALVALDVAVRGGNALDPPDATGLSRLGVDLLGGGAGDLAGPDFKRRLRDAAARFAAVAGPDTLDLALTAPATRLGDAVDLRHAALAAPRFDAAAVERGRSRLKAALQQADADAGTAATRAWYRALFPTDPYGRGPGRPGDAAGLTRERLVTWAHDRLRRDRLVIGVAGDVTPAVLAPLLDRAFGDLPVGSAAAFGPMVAAAAGDALLVVPRPGPLSVALFGGPGIARTDPDWDAALLVNQILGGGPESRLTGAVRERRGLTYAVSTRLLPLDRAPLVIGRVSSDNARIAEALDLIRSEWRRLGASGPSAEELAAAKTFLTGSLPLRLDSSARMAATLVALQLDRLPPDALDHQAARIAAVTLADAARVAARLLGSPGPTIAVAGQPAGVIATRALPPED